MAVVMPILNLFGLIFEWHDNKFELVHKNRGITLEEVASVFFDDNAITKDDFGDYDEYGGGAELVEEMTRAEAEEWAEKASRIEEVKWEEHVVTLSLPGRKYNVGR